MKVILTRDVPKVGKDGEIVIVADGYARNYLFPRQLAVVARGAAMKQHTSRVTREVARSSQLLSDAQTAAEKISGLQFQILAKANARSTRLFGSITEADVAQSIKNVTGAVVDKRKISLIDPIKLTGTYELTARLHPDVTAAFSIDVVTQEQLDARERARIAAEEKAARDAAAQAARDAALEAARAAAAAPPRVEAAAPTEEIEYDEIPDAEG